MHYLYVEDDRLSQDVMRLIMTTVMGIDTLVIFEDSEDFMARLGALDPKPDVILLDIHIQPNDGFAMLKALRADAEYGSIPVVALTASVMSSEVKKLQAAGFDGAIGKPLSVQTFPALLMQINAGEKVWHIGG